MAGGRHPLAATNLPLKHEKGGANDHIAQERPDLPALCSDVVALATTLRMNAGGVFRW